MVAKLVVAAISALLLITSSFEVEFFFSTKIEKNQENHLPQINKYDILVLVLVVQ